MSSEKIMILGAGGMGREVLTYYQDIGQRDNVVGFVEQHSTHSGQFIRTKPIYDEAELLRHKTNIRLIAGIGSPQRKKWIEDLEIAGYNFDTLIHKMTYIGENVSIGKGSIVCPGAILTCDITLGKHCIINVKASISHDCIIGNYVTISPNATLGGRVEIGNETWIGIGATIIQDIKIGSRCFIAAGAVVVNDIPDNSLVVGVPGRVVRSIDPDSWDHLLSK